MGVGVREAAVQVDVMLRGVVLEPGRPGLPDQGRAGQEAGAAPLVVDAKVGSDDHVEQRLQSAGSAAAPRR